ncbi:MAG TPA: hypothetical protein VK425_03190 [Acidimicrobiales bacterium]|nr:hypothetical protein [Acidimicrobiales bacterium]
MGFMDKVVSKAQEVGKAGQAKVDTVQAKRHMDDLYRQLGSLSYAAKTGRGRPDDATRAEEALAKLKDLEAGHPELFGPGGDGGPTTSEPGESTEEPGADVGAPGAP